VATLRLEGRCGDLDGDFLAATLVAGDGGDDDSVPPCADGTGITGLGTPPLPLREFEPVELPGAPALPGGALCGVSRFIVSRDHLANIARNFSFSRRSRVRAGCLAASSAGREAWSNSRPSVVRLTRCMRRSFCIARG